MTKRELIKKHQILSGEVYILIWQGCEFENSFETMEEVRSYLFTQIWIPAKEDEMGDDALADNNLLKYIDKDKVVIDMLKENYTVIDITNIKMNEEIKFVCY